MLPHGVHKAMVLAAGKGSRLGELSEHTPKPMVKIAGMPVIGRNLQWLARHGVDEVVINLHHLGDVIEEYVGDGSRFGLRVHWSRETELLGTAGGVKAAEAHFQDAPFLVVYGDNLFDFDLQKMVGAHAPGLCTTSIALFSTERHEHTGIAGGRVEMDRSGRILRFVEGGAAQGLDLVNAACYVLGREVLGLIPEGEFCDFGKDVFPKILRSGGILCGHVIDGYCLGLDTPEALARARAVVERDTGVEQQ